MKQFSGLFRIPQADILYKTYIFRQNKVIFPHKNHCLMVSIDHFTIIRQKQTQRSVFLLRDHHLVIPQCHAREAHSAENLSWRGTNTQINLGYLLSVQERHTDLARFHNRLCRPVIFCTLTQHTRSACIRRVEFFHCFVDSFPPVSTTGSKKAVHVLLCLCNNACKRSLAICRKRRASCPVSRLLSVPIWPACAKQGR